MIGGKGHELTYRKWQGVSEVRVARCGLRDAGCAMRDAGCAIAGALGSLTECPHFVDVLKAVSKPRAGALGSLTECPLDIRPAGT